MCDCEIVTRQITRYQVTIETRYLRTKIQVRKSLRKVEKLFVLY